MSDKQDDKAKKAEAEAAAKAAAEAEAEAAKAAAEAEAAKAAEKNAPLNLDDEVMLTAVYGRMINPFNEDEFDIGQFTKVKVDRWVLVQFEAGKLTRA